MTRRKTTRKICSIGPGTCLPRLIELSLIGCSFFRLQRRFDFHRLHYSNRGRLYRSGSKWNAQSRNRSPKRESPLDVCSTCACETMVWRVNNENVGIYEKIWKKR